MSETSRRIGILRVNAAALEIALHLPDLHNVIDVRRHPTRIDEFEVLVAGPTLPESEVGTQTPVVNYTITVTEDASNMVPTKTFTGKFS